MEFYAYMLMNDYGNDLYVGVTSNLPRRLYEHRTDAIDGFTKRYNVHKLVYYEPASDIRDAIAREKQIKGWIRAKKNEHVESMNPDWLDLAKEWA